MATRYDAGAPTGFYIPEAAPITDQELAAMSKAAGVRLPRDELSAIVTSEAARVNADKRLPKGRRVARELARIGSDAMDYAESLETLVTLAASVRNGPSSDPRVAAAGLLLHDANARTAFEASIEAACRLAREVARVGQRLDDEAATYRAPQGVNPYALEALAGVLAKAGVDLMLPGDAYADDPHPLIDAAALMVAAIERRTKTKIAATRRTLCDKLRQVAGPSRTKSSQK
jgi:hypothetical protein